MVWEDNAGRTSALGALVSRQPSGGNIIPRAHVKSWLIPLLLIALLPLSADLVFAQRRGGGRSSGSRPSGGSTSTRRSTRGEVSVRGYYRRDGTYVAPHKRTAADGNFYNNWSTYGNVNPYTGRPGTRTNPPAGYGEDVWVNGYFRSDGTYVPGHYRTAPDGDPYNNYSTRGNTNPYTGEARTVPPTVSTSPPALTSYSYEEADRSLRMRAAESLRQLGYDVDWRGHSYYELSDMALRIRQARRLQELGVNVDWQKHTYHEMSDWALRIQQARRLAELGLNVDWREHTYYEMSDWALRIRLADELREMGVNADWRQYTYYQLSEMRRRARNR